MREKVDMTFEEIFDKLAKHELVIVHMKETMTPMLYDPFENTLSEIPEGYLTYDKHHYFKNI